MWTIRPATAADHAACLEVFNAAWASIAGAPPRRLDLESFEREVEGEDVWVAVSWRRRVVGFVSVWRADEFVHHLFVLPSHQGRGIGSALLASAITALGGRASLKCADFNPAARRFYEAEGGRVLEAGVDTLGTWVRLAFQR
jgi:GNAT superfamily N-acetyltransferase